MSTSVQVDSAAHELARNRGIGRQLAELDLPRANSSNRCGLDHRDNVSTNSPGQLGPGGQDHGQVWEFGHKPGSAFGSARRTRTAVCCRFLAEIPPALLRYNPPQDQRLQTRSDAFYRPLTLIQKKWRRRELHPRPEIHKPSRYLVLASMPIPPVCISPALISPCASLSLPGTAWRRMSGKGL
jgi:hypothetical protein